MNIFKRKHSLKELIASQKETIADQEKQISVLKETIAAQKEWIDEDEKKLAIYDKIYSEIGIQMDQWFEKQTEHLFESEDL